MKEKNVKRTVWISGILVLLCVIAVCICMFLFLSYIRGFREVTDADSYDKYYVMITKDRKSSFWQSVYQGAYQKGLEENAYVDLLGENLSEDYSREDLMRIAISSGVDGIFVESDESGELTELIDEAVDRDIPVVTLYGDNTHSKRCSFVGVGSYNLGREYGRQVLKIADEQKKEKSEEKGEIQVAVLTNAYTMNSGQNIIYSGIQDAIEQEKTGETKFSVSYITVDDTNTFSVEESIRDIFMEERLPDIIICLNELNTTCVYQAVVDYNRVGQISILGYYDSDTIINAIDRNVVNATISIDTEQMGGFCVDALTEYYLLGNTSQYFTADVTLIDKSNVEQYLEGGDEDEN